MLKVVVFDVDGVIVDSTEECLVMAYNAYQVYLNTNKLITLPSEAPKAFCQRFRSIRKYIKSMDEYLIMFESDTPIKSQSEYDDTLGTLNTVRLKEYADIFFHVRKKYKNELYHQWIGLHTFHDEVISVIKSLYKTTHFYIVTGKDKSSVLDLLKNKNISIEENNIYDNYAAKNKLACLDLISLKENRKPSDCFFIDDNVTHLFEPHKNGYDCYLAEWGYVTPEHLEMANERKIKRLSLSQLKKLFP